MPSLSRACSSLRAATATCLLFSVALGCSSGDGQPAPLTGFVLVSTGGQANGATGTGGTAGEIYADLYYGGTGLIEVLLTGAVNAGFMPTAGVPIDLGANPLVISADTVIGLPAVGPPVGVPYAVLNFSNLYISDGNPTLGDEPPVTGLRVDAGATLTLPINFVGNQAAGFLLTSDIVVDGRLTVVDVTTSQRGGIQLVGHRNFQGTGSIDTFGTLPGQSGGYIAVDVEGDIYNHGPISSHGADNAGGNGGNGGAIVFQTDAPTNGGKMENTGQMVSSGGTATGPTGMGGAAGDISLIPYLALWNAGNLVAIGGEGAVNGGDGGDIVIAGFYRGELLNGGGLFSNGGAAVSGTAGNAGSISLQAWGAPLMSSGTIQALGGNGIQPNATGGAGGQIVFYTTQSDDSFEIPPLSVPAADIYVSGDVSSAGGTAMGANGTGGTGGTIGFEIENGLSMGSQSIHLYGYANMNARGANGYTAGTSAGIAMNVASVSGTPTGAITIQPTADTSGGYANPALPGSTGGDGGDITLIGGPVSYNDLRANGGQGETPGQPGIISPLP